MKGSILEGKRILAVDEDPDVLKVLEEKILQSSPNCIFDKVTTYIHAVAKSIKNLSLYSWLQKRFGMRMAFWISNTIESRLKNGPAFFF